MELREALKEQYHAGLAMLAECVERCPEEVWHEEYSGEHEEDLPRTFWLIAFHATFYTHLYLSQNEAAFERWPCQKERGVVYQQSEILDYIYYVDARIDSTIDQLDLDADETGFPWYPNMSKLSHQLMNLRHIQGHVGQLSELLMAQRIDTDWTSRSGGLVA